MTDRAVVADLGTAAGTALLAISTFSSTRSANRAARSAERSVLEGLRPLLVPSRWQDPVQKVHFMDGHWLVVQGARGRIEVTEEVAYLGMSLRNVGHGLALLHGWDVPSDTAAPPREPAAFHRLTRDIYVPAGDLGFWQGAVRDRSDPLFDLLTPAPGPDEQRLLIDLLYGDSEGGQRVITRMSLTSGPDGMHDSAADGDRALSAARHWQLDRAGAR